VYHGQGTCQFRDGHTFKGELRQNSKIMKSPDKAVTNGQTNLGMKAQLKTDSEMELENT